MEHVCGVPVSQGIDHSLRALHGDKVEVIRRWKMEKVKPRRWYLQVLRNGSAC